MERLTQHGATDGCPQRERTRAFSGHTAGVQHSEKCRTRMSESLVATADGADRIARSELRIQRGIGAASRSDQPRGRCGTYCGRSGRRGAPHTRGRTTSARRWSGASGLCPGSLGSLGSGLQDDNASLGIELAVRLSTCGRDDKLQRSPRVREGPVRRALLPALQRSPPRPAMTWYS